MSTATLDFPPIEEQRTEIATTAPSAIDLTKIDLQAVALAQFNAAHADAKKASQTLTGVVHELNTPTKLADAKSLRHRLISVPLADARKVSAGLKSKLTAVSKAVGAELAAVESAFEEADKLIKPQIDTAEAKLAEEKRIAAEKEAARVEAHKANLAKLAEPAERCRQPGMTAERIANGIKAVEAIVINRDAWEDFADRAEEQKAVTLERMRELLAKAQADEAEAARLAAEKAEQERKAAELKAEADRLAAIAADLERQRAELQAEKDRAATEAQARADEAARAEREAAEQKAREEAEERGRAEAESRRQQQAAAPAAPVRITAFVDEGVQVTTQPAAAPAPEVLAFVATAPTELPTLTLGEIKTRIAPFSIDAAGLESLGFPAKKERGACLYRTSDWRAIHAAMVKTLSAAGPQPLAA